MAVSVDPSVFAEVPGMGYSSEAVMVLSTAAAATVGEALARAGGRFYGVGEDGSERGRVAGEPEAPVVYEDELYTPNSVSGVLVGRRGPWMYVDCKSQISDAMRRRFIAVLVEELVQDAYSRRAYPEKYTLSAYRRNRTVQEDARRILRRCLVTRSETFALLARRE